jgi:hypothetical protein
METEPQPSGRELKLAVQSEREQSLYVSGCKWPEKSHYIGRHWHVTACLICHRPFKRVHLAVPAIAKRSSTDAISPRFASAARLLLPQHQVDVPPASPSGLLLPL